jgi:hypothetical protein
LNIRHSPSSRASALEERRAPDRALSAIAD